MNRRTFIKGAALIGISAVIGGVHEKGLSMIGGQVNKGGDLITINVYGGKAYNSFDLIATRKIYAARRQLPNGAEWVAPEGTKIKLETTDRLYLTSVRCTNPYDSTQELAMPIGYPLHIRKGDTITICFDKPLIEVGIA